MLSQLFEKPIRILVGLGFPRQLHTACKRRFPSLRSQEGHSARGRRNAPDCGKSAVETRLNEENERRPCAAAATPFVWEDLG